MTFRIDRFVSGRNAIVFCVCGRMQIECVDAIKELVEEETMGSLSTFRRVTLANRDAATFLAVCALKGIELRDSPLFFEDGLTKKRRATRRSIPRLQVRARGALQLTSTDCLPKSASQ
jgi:hypothetical protein